MKEILRNSDFALKISFIDIANKSLKITNFRFAYSTPYSQSVIAEFDGENYTPNCRPENDGVVVIFEKPKFNAGQLSVQRSYCIQSDTFENGIKEITQIEQLQIQIVDSYSTTPKIPTPMPLNPSNEDVAFYETPTVEALIGPQGISGVNYALEGEQELEGEFWYDKQGVARQVFYKTIITTSPQNFIRNADSGQFQWMWNINLASPILDYCVVRCEVGSSKQFNTHYGLAYTFTGGFTNTDLALWFKEESNPMYNNQPSILTVHYTKI